MPAIPPYRDSLMREDAYLGLGNFFTWTRAHGHDKESTLALASELYDLAICPFCNQPTEAHAGDCETVN